MFSLIVVRNNRSRTESGIRKKMLISASFCDTFNLLNHFFISCECSCGLLFRNFGRGAQRQADDEGGAFASLGFKMNGAAVLLNHNGVRDSQALPGALA